MNFRPLHDRVVVRRLEEDEKTAGGIIIPETAKEKPMEGEVLAVGPGERNEQGKVTPLDVKAGDRTKISSVPIRLPYSLHEQFRWCMIGKRLGTTHCRALGLAHADQG